MAAALGGLDALVFTRRRRENAAEVRSRAAGRLGFLVSASTRSATRPEPGDRDIGPPDAPVRSLRIAAREDLEIARQVRTVLRG